MTAGKGGIAVGDHGQIILFAKAAVLQTNVRICFRHPQGFVGILQGLDGCSGHIPSQHRDLGL